jgi:hypothetical protein
MLRVLRFFGLLVLNVVVAIVATGILESAIGTAFHPHSLGAALWNAWILSIGGAAFIGFGMWRTWRSDSTKWAWLLVAMWFGLRLILAVGSGSAWYQFSGSGCADGIRSVGCRNFFLFTISLIRGVSYSLGAYIASLALHADGRQEPQSFSLRRARSC